MVNLRILILSDSHAGISFMRFCISKLRPDHVVHLGDHYEDGKVLAEENPTILFHQVPGNCDHDRCDPWAVDILCYPIGGVMLMMTHGHKHGVKSGQERLIADARSRGADAVLYGHTHTARCTREEDGLWVVNPGSCGSYSGSVAVMEIEDKKISACRILAQTDILEYAH